MKSNAGSIHMGGIALFLFIPLVLFLFLRFPFGILPSFAVAIVLMFGHRFIAIPFMDKNRLQRCLFCGRTSRPRSPLTVASGAREIAFECCAGECLSRSKRFFDFCSRYRLFLRMGIFLPLIWYVLSMIAVGLGKFSMPIQWERFIFQFFIAVTVVSISFLYGSGKETESPSFPFPVHNLFLLGINNILWVFRLVGIWWIAASLWFLYGIFVHTT